MPRDIQALRRTLVIGQALRIRQTVRQRRPHRGIRDMGIRPRVRMAANTNRRGPCPAAPWRRLTERAAEESAASQGNHSGGHAANTARWSDSPTNLPISVIAAGRASRVVRAMSRASRGPRSDARCDVPGVRQASSYIGLRRIMVLEHCPVKASSERYFLQAPRDVRPTLARVAPSHELPKTAGFALLHNGCDSGHFVWRGEPFGRAPAAIPKRGLGQSAHRAATAY